MKEKWEWGNFDDARTRICDFINNNVKMPIDVLIGYSQGCMAITQVMNDILSYKMICTYLNNVKGLIFIGTNNHI